MMYATTAAGLVILLLAGETLVRGSVGLARAFGLPPLLIGLTIVAFGTSAPELFVSINAALDGAPGLSIGNIVGSNIANIWLVLGTAALLAPTPCSQPGIRRNVLMMIGASLLFIGLSQSGTLGFKAGFTLFACLVAFLGYSAYDGLKSRSNGSEAQAALDDFSSANDPILLDIVWLGVGLVGLPLGAHLIVEGATGIATRFGVSDALIGLTIVAIGTSLPELATTGVAAWRKHTDVAVGNVVGSCLFNILAIGGITALVVPVPVPDEFLRWDLWIMLASALSIVPFVMMRHTLKRPAGILFLALYVWYLASLFRGTELA